MYNKIVLIFYYVHDLLTTPLCNVKFCKNRVPQRKMKQHHDVQFMSLSLNHKQTFRFCSYPNKIFMLKIGINFSMFCLDSMEKQHIRKLIWMTGFETYFENATATHY